MYKYNKFIISIKLSFLLVCFFVILLFYNISGVSAAVFSGGRDWTFNSGDGTYSSFNSEPLEFVEQSDGKIITVGTFTTYSSYLVNRVLRFNIDGTIDTDFSTLTSADDSVTSVALQTDQKVIFGGSFQYFNQVLLNRLVRVNSDGSIDDTFETGFGFNGTVNDVSIQNDGKIIVVGEFTQYDGNNTNNIVRLNSDGSIDNSFLIGNGFDDIAHKVLIDSNSKIYVIGDFTQYNGNSVNRILRLNSNGTIDNTFDTGSGSNGAIRDITFQSSGKLIVVGDFTNFNGTNINRIVRLETSGVNDGDIDSTFTIGTGTAAIIRTISILNDDKILIAGDFSSYNGTARNRIARLNIDGTLDTTYVVGTGANATVYTSLVQSNGKYLFGGDFNNYNQNPINQFVRTNSDGSFDNTFGVISGYSNINNIVVTNDNKFILLGSFLVYMNQSYNRILRLNSDGSIDNTYNVGTGTNGAIFRGYKQQDGKLIIVGAFSQFNGTSRNRIARLNNDGSLDTTFNPGTAANNWVYVGSIQSDGKIIAGGSFTNFNGVPKNRLVRLNSDGSLDNSFNIGTGPNNTVFSLTYLNSGKILIGGDFTEYNGVPVNRIARLNSDGSLDSTFNSGAGFNERVFHFEVQDDQRVLVVGYFTTFDGVTVNRIVMLNTNGSRDLSFNTGSGANDAIMNAKNSVDGKIVIGGYFTSFNGVDKKRLLRLNPDGSIDPALDYNVGTASGEYVFGIANYGPTQVIVGGQFSTANGSGTNSIVKINNIPLYQAENLDNSLDMLVDNYSIKVGTLRGTVNPNQPVNLVLNSGTPVSDFVVDFSQGDVDFTGVISEVDMQTGRSYISGLNSIDVPEVSSTHSLYVLKLLNQDSVYVCPNAEALEEVYLGCSGGYSISEGSAGLTVENISGQDYWVIDGLTGTGALGLSQYGTPFTITPNSDEVNSTQEVVLSYGTTTGFAALDKVQFIFESTAGFTLANTCATPTTDANGDSTADGSASIVGGNVYEYTFSNTVTGPATVSFCVNVTSPATAGSYSVSLTDDNGSFGSAMYYVGDDNDVFVIANVMPSLSFNIRTLADDADTNVCNFGTVSSSTPIPDYNDQADIASECGYSLAVGTNAVGGFQTQIVADGPLNGSGGSMADLSNGGSFSAGVEAYGFASITPSTSGRNPLGGLYTESILRSGNFDLAANTGTSIPTTIQTMITYNNGVQYTAGVDNVDVTRVVHGIVIGSGTPAGYYDQVITYTTTANF